MSGALDGRTALVTGAGRGIGRATAEALAREGAALLLVARSEEQLADAARACGAAGAPHVRTATVDLTDRDALDQLCALAAEVDVLVNNAGRAPSAPLERADDAHWDAVLELNARVPFALCRAALPAMAARGFGRVVNVASLAGLRGYAYVAPYVASKHALVGLTRALAAEAAQRWKDRDLTVNAVCPGFVDTALVDDSARNIAATTALDEAGAKQTLGALNAGGRLLTPDEVAARILALVLEAPGNTSGEALAFEGVDD